MKKTLEISSVEIVPHSGAIVISWWAEEYGNEWLESTTYYGYTKQEAVKAWKEQHGAKHH